MSLLDGLEEHSKQNNAGLCWQKSLSTPLHSQNVGVQGSHMDAGSRGRLFGGDFRCGSSSRAMGADQSGRETRRAFLMGEHLDSASQGV